VAGAASALPGVAASGRPQPAAIALATSTLSIEILISPPCVGVVQQTRRQRLSSDFFLIVQLASLAFDAQNVKMTWLRVESR
jgi:hypothetical protein